MGFRRDKKKSSNCPVCGVYVCEGYQSGAASAVEHKCDPEFVRRSERARDAAMEREYEPRDGRSLSRRLSDGFKMLDDDDHGDEE